MNDRINEHDMTKKMMSAIRAMINKDKTLIKEEIVPQPNMQDSINQLVPGDDLPEPVNKVAPRAKVDPQPLIDMDSTYFELDKNDSRFKQIFSDLSNLELGLEVTSIFINPKKDIVITGKKETKENNLIFTMSLFSGMEYESKTDGEFNDSEIKTALNGYLENMQRNITKTKDELSYNEKIDGKK
jgi:hypothetical protein